MLFKTLYTTFCLASFFLHSTSSEVLYGSTFNVDRNERLEKLNIEFIKGDDPVRFSEQVSSELELDEPSRNWFLETFAHSLARLDEKEVLSLSLGLPTGEEKVTVREGDDLSQLAHVTSYLHGLTVTDTNTIYQNLISKLPQHTSKEWKERREAGISRILTQRLQLVNPPASSSDECILTLGIDISNSSVEDVTAFIESFPPSNLLCEVIVVGKHSDVETKKQLLNSFPQFSYFLKSNRDSRASKEVLSTLGTSRFVLFIEDFKAIAEETDSLVRQGLDLLKTEQGEGQDVILQFATKEEAFTLKALLFARS
ncbi:predicted protein [Chaetoceros tenuissimus]|uniref:Uncharacterized protein n=1 Tax=Chaetoceros tenuissimus TaxID=426638 RepID=A0AAD3CNQ2_9STRA|nr:predicted protein [Chaetoceros tenuissimus]